MRSALIGRAEGTASGEVSPSHRLLKCLGSVFQPGIERP
jgi:hypothetical protein